MSPIRTLTLLLAALSLLLAACGPAQTATPDAPEYTLGEVSVAQIQSEPGWEDLRAEDYTPDPSLVEAIRAGAEDIQVMVFLGFWCPDSQREVPRWIKLAEAAGLREDQITYISLDYTKTDADGLTEQYGIEYVPTFVILRDRQEIGRIIESPEETLEADLAAILAAS